MCQFVVGVAEAAFVVACGQPGRLDRKGTDLWRRSFLCLGCALHESSRLDQTSTLRSATQPRAGNRNRTGDLLITSQLLYQLSYAGTSKASRILHGKSPRRKPKLSSPFTVRRSPFIGCRSEGAPFGGREPRGLEFRIRGSSLPVAVGGVTRLSL